MKTYARAAAAAMLLGTMVGASAVAAPKDAEVLAPIHTFADNLSKGDMAAAATAYAPDSTIIDEFSPYHWSGNAFAGWGADFGVFAKKTGTTDPRLIVKAPSRVDVDGDHAYVVAPAVFAFKARGKAMEEPGVMAFALQGGAGGWKIASWSWAGGKAYPVGGHKKA